jgi:hypothetical protein
MQLKRARGRSFTPKRSRPFAADANVGLVTPVNGATSLLHGLMGAYWLWNWGRQARLLDIEKAVFTKTAPTFRGQVARASI